MVGNDVVDLRDPESRPESLHPRFDTRVFTASEREAIGSGRGSSRVRWKLWAAKEAAYKLIRKRASTTVFSPIRFEVALDESGQALVTHGPDRVAVGYEENDGAVHAVASCPAARPAAVFSAWRRLGRAELAAGDAEVPSRAVRALLCEHVAARLRVEAEEVEVRRDGRVPRLWVADRPAAADVSLSHHGDWLGFACELRAFRELEEPGAAAS